MIPNPYIIHLDSCIEREGVKPILESVFKINIPFFPAIKGSDKNIVWYAPFGKRRMTPGQLGCNESHVALYTYLINKGDSTIFEDDAEVVFDTLPQLHEFIDSTPKDFDIILLGYNEPLERIIDNKYIKVKKFFGTHAMIVKENARKLFIEEYNYLLTKNESRPTDWMWSSIIQKHKLNVYSSRIPFIIQKKGLISQITGSIRR